MGTQVYAILAIVVILGLGVGKFYHVVAEATENRNRLAAAEALREARDRADQRAATERHGRRQAEKAAQDAEARGERLAAEVELLKDTEECPSKCYSFRWRSR